MPLLPFDLPPGLLAHAARGEDWAAWIAGLPRLVRDLLDEWELSVDGVPMHGHTALVVPVRVDGEPLVLKVVWPHEEARHESLALQHWHGRGAVRLVRADPRRDALLLERAGPADLSDVWDVEACEVVAGLYAALHVPAPPQLVRLSRYAATWADELTGFARVGAVPRRVVEQAGHLARTFSDDPATDGTMIHGDLHYANVLASDRVPWLAIDPKPLSGDPHHEVAPLLSNRWDEVVGSGDVRSAVRGRFHAVVDVAGLDEERARDWVVVREVVSAMWAVQDGDAERVSRTVAIVKAVQD